MYASLRSFVRDARHNRILAIPAGLYAVRCCWRAGGVARCGATWGVGLAAGG